MATHFKILAWRIPWTEEPGGLQSTVCKESDTTKGQMLYYINFGKVGIRHYYLARKQSFCPNVNLDKLWTSVSELIQ